MRRARNILLGLLGFGAWIVIGISGDMIHERKVGLTTDGVVYVLLLTLSVIYFHWLFRLFVMPLYGLSKSERVDLSDRSKKHYSKGFFRGAIGLGYFCLALYVFALLMDMPGREPPNFALGAIFFIGLGTLAQVRGVVLALTNDRDNGSIEQTAAPNGGPATQLGNSSVGEGPPSVS